MPQVALFHYSISDSPLQSSILFTHPMATKSCTPLRSGIYAPTLTFFHPTTEDLDLPTIAKHSVRLARAALVGLVTLGSNGEAVHVSRSEKATVTRTTSKRSTKLATQTSPSSAERRSNSFAELWSCAERALRLGQNTYCLCLSATIGLQWTRVD